MTLLQIFQKTSDDHYHDGPQELSFLEIIEYQVKKVIFEKNFQKNFPKHFYHHGKIYLKKLKIFFSAEPFFEGSFEGF